MKKVNAEMVRSMLRNQVQGWVERATVMVFSKQTDDEKNELQTKHKNNRGFNKGDALKMSLIASKIQSGAQLSEEERETAEVKIHKYARQVAEIMSGL